jgi:urea transport system substrate-binding protein
MAANQAGSLERAAVTEVLESGLSFDSPEGQIKLDPQSHHVVHTVHLARVNTQRGFAIMETFENLDPSDTKDVCDLIANPDQHTQFTPKF